MRRLRFYDVDRANDIVQKQGYPIILMLGCHTNDRMTSFCLHTLSGWLFEYGWRGLQIDDSDWDVKFYNLPKVWDHFGYNPAKKRKKTG